ncbi:MAG: hypothetical protein M3178_09395 [Pseudomonadota bacterium]|nr:hypothetical protein [Pseudomonadota bacterium]
MFRRTLLASAGAMALTGAALAADLPSRAPPAVLGRNVNFLVSHRGSG